jgi:hypothetical protein
MQDKMLIRHMGILVEMVDSSRVKTGRPALDTVNLVAFLEEKFRQIGAVLSSYAGDESSFHCAIYSNKFLSHFALWISFVKYR